MPRRSLFATALAGGSSGGPAVGRSLGGAVDLLLALAMDASGSLSDEGLALQRSGHARAVTSDAFLDAVALGFHGRVALAAIEWTGHERQSLIVPWSIVQTGADARQFAAALLRASRPIPGYTSISGGIDFAVTLLATAPYAAMRRVIDVSGNGPNNDGRPASEARDDAVAAGTTVNGLPILDATSNLAGYFADNVIGGPGAFMVVAQDAGSFERAILRKLVLEVANVPIDRSGRGPREPGSVAQPAVIPEQPVS